MNIELNSNFYDPEAVKKTARIFNEHGLGEFRVEVEGDKIKIEINCVEEEMRERVRFQFLNYSISETINSEK